MIVSRRHLLSIVAAMPEEAQILVGFERDVGMNFASAPKPGEAVNVVMQVRAPYVPAWQREPGPHEALPDFDSYDDPYDERDELAESEHEGGGTLTSRPLYAHARVVPLAKPVALNPGESLDVTFELRREEPKE